MSKKYSVETEMTKLPGKEEETNSYCPPQEERIVINVAGLRFETQRSTLERFGGGTLLGDPLKRSRYYDPGRDEFFFDRNRPCFDAVLNYYQSGGRLLRPANVPLQVFIEEVRFYELDEKTIDRYLQSEGLAIEKARQLPNDALQRKIWLLLEYPNSSLAARILALLSLAVILLSVVVYCLETLPVYVPARTFDADAKDANTTQDFTADPFFIIETACVVFFMVELLTRFAASPNRPVFFRDPMNAIDLVAIVPYFGVLVATLLARRGASGGWSVALVVFKVMWLVRLLRLFRLSRQWKGLRILEKTLRASVRWLGALGFFFLVGIVFFSSAVYYAEINGDRGQFNSIPDAFWWAVITMTTVGYGDMLPVTAWGRLVGSLCAVAGVLTIALAVTVILSNFSFFYRRSAADDIEEDFGHVRCSSATCPEISSTPEDRKYNAASGKT